MNDKTDDEMEDTSGAHVPQHTGHRDVKRTKWGKGSQTFGPSGKKAVKRSDKVGKRQSNGPSGKKALELFMNCTQPVVFHSATTLQETRNINVETDYETQ